MNIRSCHISSQNQPMVFLLIQNQSQNLYGSPRDFIPVLFKLKCAHCSPGSLIKALILILGDLMLPVQDHIFIAKLHNLFYNPHTQPPCLSGLSPVTFPLPLLAPAHLFSLGTCSLCPEPSFLQIFVRLTLSPSSGHFLNFF